MADIKKAGKRNRNIRFSILIFVLVLTTWMGLAHAFGKKFKIASIDSFCPFGGLESLYGWLKDGTFLKRTNFNDLLLIIIITLLAFLLRRTFCGNICPLGTIQELFGKLRKFFFKKRFLIPVKVDRYLRYLKYAVLVVVLAATWKLGTLVIRPYDPWPVFHHLYSEDLLTEFPYGLAVFVIMIIGSFLYDRFFCKYLCPLGAFLGIVSKIGFFRVRRNKETCISCRLCTKVCPVNIEVDTSDDVKTAECLNCNECVNVCPVENTLTISGRKKGKIGSLSFMTVTFIAILAVVGVTSVSGSFTWLMPSLGYEGNLEDFDPDDIRGKYTFEEVSIATGIPAEVLKKEFELTDEEFVHPIKESGRETSLVREFVKEQQNR